MLQIETEHLEDQSARLVVSIDTERVDKAKKAAASRIAQEVNIPGFRKGKAPYRVIVQRYGEGVILEEVLETLGQDVYKEALDETGLSPYAPGSLVDVALDPMVLTYTVPLEPVVELGPYREIRVSYEEETVEESDIEDFLQQLRDQQATLEPVERAVALNDVARVDIVGHIKTEDGEDEDTPEPWLDVTEVRVLVTEESTYPVPGFPKKLIGLSAEDEESFEITLGDDDDLPEDLQDATIAFNVKVHEVLERDLPELDDEFAQSASDEETLDALRDRIREDMAANAIRLSRRNYMEKVYEALEENASVRFPDVMLDEQIDSMVSELDTEFRGQGLNIDEYLKMNDQSMEELREDLEDDAASAIRRALMLREVIQHEGLKISDAEIDDEIQTMVLSFGTQATLAQQFFGSDEARLSIENRLLSDKGVDRLIAIAKGEAPELEEIADDPQDESEDVDHDTEEEDSSPDSDE